MNVLKEWKGRTYVINLQTRDDRLEEISAEIERVGSKWEQFQVPFDGLTSMISDDLFKGSLSEKDPKVVRILRFQKHPLGGMIGCANSHLCVMKYHSTSSEPAFILEDDTRFNEHFTKSLMEEINSSDSKVITLGITFLKDPTLTSSSSSSSSTSNSLAVPVAESLYSTPSFRGCTAYFMTPQACAKVVQVYQDHITPNFWITPTSSLSEHKQLSFFPHIDHAIEIIMTPDIKVARPYAVYQSDSPSDNIWHPNMKWLNKLQSVPNLFKNVTQKTNFIYLANLKLTKQRQEFFHLLGKRAPNDSLIYFSKCVKKPLTVTLIMIILIILLVCLVKKRK